MQPRIPLFYRMRLDLHGLKASCYQPVHLFLKSGRKLPNVAEPADPWQVFLRRDNGEFGVVGEGVGATLPDALEIALKNRRAAGLLHAMARLGEQLDLLTETVHASQD